MSKPPRYPRTPHWPWSEKVHRDDSYHKEPEVFLNRPVVVTEKIDGGNTALHCGEVYARSIQAPSHDGWMAMVRKNHAWKIDPEAEFLTLYGEDIYGVHSIEYHPVEEQDTFRLFASRLTVDERDIFSSWTGVEKYAENYKMNTVPVVFRGTFKTLDEITEFFTEERKKPSAIGPEAEGFVMRFEETFEAVDFPKAVCKFVRANHVQTDEHWTRNWQKCEIKR